MSEQRDLISPQYNQQSNLPNATAVLVLGIISILGGLCYGVVGFICGIIAVILGNKDRKLYFGAPELYSAASYGTSNAGRVCAIIGICLGSLWIFFYLLMAVIIMFNLGHTRW
jgi:hypothetical protein